jgi:putative membrane protein
VKIPNLHSGPLLLRALEGAIIFPLAIALLAGCERVDRQMVPGDSIRSGWASQERPSALVPAPDQRAFLETATQTGLFEIEASRVAIARGGSAAVRRFAEATLRDRVAIETDLQQLAQSVGVALPTHLSDRLQARLAVLSEVDAADFDRAYARTVGVATQEETVAAFERAADQRGERVQRFAANQLPALREHLEWARKLASELDRTRMADGSAPSTSRLGASS